MEVSLTMILYQLFPNGKKFALTFSYDDGRTHDRRLVKILNRHGLKGTFHLNSAKFGVDGRYVTADEVPSLYKGHEISCHTAHHYMPVQLPLPALFEECITDRQALESLAGYPVTGMSYPFGNYDDSVISTMQSAGIVYSRTTQAHHSFKLPTDFMTWHPTCHHRDCVADGEKFLNLIKANKHYTGLSLFYVWGHSYEFDDNQNWELIEGFAERMGGREEIWYATNMEIYRYLTALKQLVISASGKQLYNPTATTLWVMADGKPISICAGETVSL